MRLRRRLVQCSNIVHLSASESHGEHVAEEADVSEAAVRKAIQQDQSSTEADADSLLWSVQDQLCRTADLPRAPWWTEAQEERGGTEEQPAFVRSNVVQSAPLWALWRHVYWIGCIRCSHSRRKTSKGSDIRKKGLWSNFRVLVFELHRYHHRLPCRNWKFFNAHQSYLFRSSSCTLDSESRSHRPVRRCRRQQRPAARRLRQRNQQRQTWYSENLTWSLLRHRQESRKSLQLPKLTSLVCSMLPTVFSANTLPSACYMYVSKT